MREFWYRLRRGALYSASLLPFSVLYVLSDVIYFIAYHIVRYRRRIVAENLRNSFPEKSGIERRDLEKRFYRSFCDISVEMFKLLSISREELMRRMTFSGAEELEKSLETHPQSFIYLGHFCNWEWISSMPLWFSPGRCCGQLYHPLRSPFFNRLFLEMRSRFGAENIPKDKVMRHLLTLHSNNTKVIVGFISDQTPKWANIHDWVEFMNQDTPVFTGTERIAKKTCASVYFAYVERIRRGYYHCDLQPMTYDVKSYPDYKLTEEYMARLEQMIRTHPECWLWSHNRWKRHRSAASPGDIENSQPSVQKGRSKTPKS